MIFERTSPPEQRRPGEREQSAVNLARSSVVEIGESLLLGFDALPNIVRRQSIKPALRKRRIDLVERAGGAVARQLVGFNEDVVPFGVHGDAEGLGQPGRYPPVSFTRERLVVPIEGDRRRTGQLPGLQSGEQLLKGVVGADIQNQKVAADGSQLVAEDLQSL
jgi:hypothetical protein